MGDKSEIAVVVDYLSGLNLEQAAQKHDIARSRVVAILDSHKIARRNVAEARRAAAEKMTPEERAAKTRAAREAQATARRLRAPRRKDVRAVLSWCDEQQLTPSQRRDAASFRTKGVMVQANYPCGEHNIYLAVPKALLAIELVPRRLSHKAAGNISRKLAHLLGNGWFVAFLTSDVAVHFDSVVALARMRAGAPMAIDQKAQVRKAMEPFFARLEEGHAAAVQMAQGMVQPIEPRAAG